VLGRAANRELLSTSARVIWLTVEPGEAAKRLGAPGSAERPLLHGGVPEEGLRALLQRRGAAYAAAADATVETDGLVPEEVAERILAGLPAGG